MGDFNPRQIRKALKKEPTDRLLKDLAFYKRYQAYENERTKFIVTEIKAVLDGRGVAYE